MKKFRVHFSIGGVKKSVTVKKEIADKAIEHVQGTYKDMYVLRNLQATEVR